MSTFSMFPTKSLLSLLSIAVSLGVSVMATPPSSLELFVRMVPPKGRTIADIDRTRVTAMMGGDQSNKSSFPVEDATFGYTASIGVGNPPTTYQLVIDTGSSNTWVGAGKPYHQTSTSKSTGQNVAVTYGSGNFSGNEFIDEVTLSPELVIKSQSIGVANFSTGFEGVDGILGVGPTDLTNHTINNSSLLVPTVTDNLYKQGSISIDLVSIAFAPTTAENDNTTVGLMTFGGTDSTRFIGDIEYVPITQTPVSSFYWGLNQSATYGSTTLFNNKAGIVDTGTTLVLLATEYFNAYANLTGGKMNNATGLLEINKSQYQKLQTLNFQIGNTVYPLSQNAQIWPRALNTLIGGQDDSIFLIVGDLGDLGLGSGLDFIDGFAFLQRFYSVFDTTNRQIGLAFTPDTFALSN
ncbi:hypothetical protein PILCRDRAFT_787222 [Piloderma croceum F 1598]|uniref:Peptidase A1 domain-containing protein n=1 Tax=Piloderma croceum (strain F 1598) TaxID=765440 RepID=A0A0C3BVV5_PILCF|nr:hypothetical protein PILCRDRAFT_787222 [Piloderma croceum F 1598]